MSAWKARQFEDFRLMCRRCFTVVSCACGKPFNVFWPAWYISHWTTAPPPLGWYGRKLARHAQRLLGAAFARRWSYRSNWIPKRESHRPRRFGKKNAPAVGKWWAKKPCTSKPKTGACSTSTSHVISRTFLCHLGVKYSYTRNAIKWKLTIMFL